MCHAGGNYGEPFNAERGITQGGPLSSLIFNVCVDAVVRGWLNQTLDEDIARDRIQAMWLSGRPMLLVAEVRGSIPAKHRGWSRR